MPKLPTWSRRVSEEHVIGVRFTASALRPAMAGLSASTNQVKYFVYIVKCRDDSFYTGITWNLKQRINQHNTSKLGAKSLRGKLPVELVYYEELETKSQALKREYEIKGWRREKKEKLITKCVR